LLLTLDFGAMAFVKYTPAVTEWVNALAKGELPVWELAVPLGLSYFTFQSAGFLIDAYRGKVTVPCNPLKLWLFVGYFPQLLPGGNRPLGQL
ncbi:hypothetical protein, partial [Salmonella enterica]|uniref:hypothetical protein n=1 Tax=Salmonella enterica TaxID=28901 RepID=UPI0020C25E59